MYSTNKKSNYKTWLIVIVMMVAGLYLTGLFKEQSIYINKGLTGAIVFFLNREFPQKKYTKRDIFCIVCGFIFCIGVLCLSCTYLDKYFPHSAKLPINAAWYERIIFLLVLCTILSLFFYIGYSFAYRTSEHFIWSDTKDYINDRYI